MAHTIWTAIVAPTEKLDRWSMRDVGPPAFFQHYAYCSCGWHGQRWPTQSEALGEAQEHTGGDGSSVRPPRDGGF